MLSQIFKIFKAKKDSHLSNQDFYAKHKNQLKNIELGCSFAPEQWNNEMQDQALKALKIVVEKLKIKEIRLGIRWNVAAKNEDQINLDYYSPFLEYCFSQNINICLNIGPIKTFRWPEEHIPQYILDKLGSDLPADKKEIPVGNKLYLEAEKYLDQLLNILKNKYSKEQLFNIKQIQIENEGFYNYGIHNWSVNTEYLTNLVKIINNHFSEIEIMMSSAGRLNLNKIDSFFTQLDQDGIKNHEELRIGYNYYYKLFPIKNIPFINQLDNIVLSWPWDMTPQGLQKSSKVKGYRIEIAEGQAETFPPGNKADEFKYMILRCADNFTNNLSESNKLLVRIWGIEVIANKILENGQDQQDKDIVEFIKQVHLKK